MSAFLCSPSAPSPPPSPSSSSMSSTYSVWREARPFYFPPYAVKMVSSSFSSSSSGDASFMEFTLVCNMVHSEKQQQWAVKRSFADFRNLYKELCRRDKSTFDRLGRNQCPMLLSPLQQSIESGEGELRRRLMGFLLKAVDLVDMFAFDPLVSFLGHDVHNALYKSAISAIVSLQSTFRAHKYSETIGLRKLVRTAWRNRLALIYKSKIEENYSKLWRVCEGCALLLCSDRNFVPLFDMHTRFASLEQKRDMLQQQQESPIDESFYSHEEEEVCAAIVATASAAQNERFFLLAKNDMGSIEFVLYTDSAMPRFVFKHERLLSDTRKGEPLPYLAMHVLNTLSISSSSSSSASSSSSSSSSFSSTTTTTTTTTTSNEVSLEAEFACDVLLDEVILQLTFFEFFLTLSEKASDR